MNKPQIKFTKNGIFLKQKAKTVVIFGIKRDGSFFYEVPKNE